MLFTLRSGAGATAAGAGCNVSTVSVMSDHLLVVTRHRVGAGRRPMTGSTGGFRYSRDAGDQSRGRGVLGPPLSRRTTAELLHHHPSHSGLRGSSTVLIFS